MQVTDRGFTVAFMDHFPDALDCDQESARAEDGMTQLIRHAKKTGQPRDDIHPTGITLPLLVNGGLAGQRRDIALTASRRLLAPFSGEPKTDIPAPCHLRHPWD